MPSSLIDQRIEMPPHTHEWLSGDRYGRVTHVDGRRVYILLDKSSRSIVKRLEWLDQCRMV